MIILGIDLGSSSIKVSLFDSDSGVLVGDASYPPEEMQIESFYPDWAEQDPALWIDNLKSAIGLLGKGNPGSLKKVSAIGISYQMHGLVAVDRAGMTVRKSIIWCDSRAVKIGDKAFEELGNEYCLNHLLNSPGNFTASKLKWVKENEPKTYEKIDKVMLPGDYIAFQLTGEICTTRSGLSEGIFWDYNEDRVSDDLLNYYGLEQSLLPDIVDTFSVQGYITKDAAVRFGLPANIPVTYRAGDQPNNAFSLNVLNPGELAATAGTSGVVYGVSDQKTHDPLSRVNTFLHVNHTAPDPRLGILLCLNATGILNSWVRQVITPKEMTYDDMNREACKAPAGSEGLIVLPFGNGAERILQNQQPGASFYGLNFNIHTRSHLLRAVQEGIVFSLNYGLEIMDTLGLDLSVIRAGKANMFLSELFRQSFADIAKVKIELYNTDGAEGAARGAAVGLGYTTISEAFENLKMIETVVPRENIRLDEAYHKWKAKLGKNVQLPG